MPLPGEDHLGGDIEAAAGCLAVQKVECCCRERASLRRNSHASAHVLGLSKLTQPL
jgi:hypothetical protein